MNLVLALERKLGGVLAWCFDNRTKIGAHLGGGGRLGGSGGRKQRRWRLVGLPARKERSRRMFSWSGR